MPAIEHLRQTRIPDRQHDCLDGFGQSVVSKTRLCAARTWLASDQPRSDRLHWFSAPSPGAGDGAADRDAKDTVGPADEP